MVDRTEHTEFDPFAVDTPLDETGHLKDLDSIDMGDDPDHPSILSLMEERDQITLLMKGVADDLEYLRKLRELNEANTLLQKTLKNIIANNPAIAESLPVSLEKYNDPNTDNDSISRETIAREAKAYTQTIQELKTDLNYEEVYRKITVLIDRVSKLSNVLVRDYSDVLDEVWSKIASGQLYEEIRNEKEVQELAPGRVSGEMLEESKRKREQKRKFFEHFDELVALLTELSQLERITSVKRGSKELNVNKYAEANNRDILTEGKLIDDRINSILNARYHYEERFLGVEPEQTQTEAMNAKLAPFESVKKILQKLAEIQGEYDLNVDSQVSAGLKSEVLMFEKMASKGIIQRLENGESIARLTASKVREAEILKADQANIEKAIKKAAQAQSEVGSLTRQMEEASAESKRAITTFRAKIKSLQADYKELEKSQRIGHTLLVIFGAVALMMTIIASKSYQDVREQESEISELKAANNSLETDIQNARAERDIKNDQIDTLNDQISKLATDTSGGETEVRDIMKISELEEKIKELEQELEDLTTKNAQLSSNESSRITEINVLKNQLREAQGKIQTLQSERRSSVNELLEAKDPASQGK